VKSNK